MKILLRMTLIFCVCLSMISCAGKPTPYQQSDGLGDGYRNYPLGGGAYRVEFWANINTDPETIEAYLMRRSTELCKEKGYPSFKLINEQPQVDEHTRQINIQCKN